MNASDFISIVAAFISATSLITVFVFQIKGKNHSHRTETASFSLDMHNSFCLAEEKLHFAKSNEDKLFYINQYMNLLEMYCGMVNKNAVPKDLVELVTDRLCNDIRFINSNPDLLDHINQALSSPLTFSEIRKFYKANRDKVKLGQPK